MVREVKGDLNIRRFSVVKYWAPWCSPCKIVGPIFEDVEKLYTTDFFSVNVEEKDNVQIVEDANISSVPTIKILNEDGVEIDSIYGIFSEEELIKRIDEALGQSEE